MRQYMRTWAACMCARARSRSEGRAAAGLIFLSLRLLGWGSSGGRNELLTTVGFAMSFCKGLLLGAAASCLIAGVSGCASDLIEVRQGSAQVAVANAGQVSRCESKGHITVSVLARLGFISRGDETVEGNLLQLARNGAVNAGGDTVVKGDSTEFGKRAFAIYKCRP